MGITTVFVLALAIITPALGKLHCKNAETKIPDDWVSLADECTKSMKNQVEVELTAAMTYLAMGAHFSQDTINRPGFAEFFFKSASEEREHALKIIEYLLMRGELTENISDLIKNPKPLKKIWSNGNEALKEALELETSVTKKIREIITVCEAATTGSGERKSVFNDYHLVDYLTGEFLTEQYEGQRDLAGKISTLGKMINSHGALGEFLFDKKLLA